MQRNGPVMLMMVLLAGAPVYAQKAARSPQPLIPSPAEGQGSVVVADPLLSHVDDTPQSLQVWSRLAGLGVDVDGMRVSYDETTRTITLAGTVSNILDLRRSEDLAELSPDVEDVVNMLALKVPDVSDDLVEARLLTALLNDPAADAYEIDLEVRRGAVTLSGKVESSAEKVLAELVALSIPGVRSVKNELRVDVPAYRLDSEVRAEIEQLIVYDPRLNDAFITVEVESGQATLTGLVENEAERELVVAHARTAYVAEVDARGLEVAADGLPPVASDVVSEEIGEPFTGAPVPDEAAIEEAVQEALQAAPDVDSYGIRASVKGSTVVLEGVVDTLRALRAAQLAVLDVKGIKSVVNRITFNPSQAIPDEVLEKRVARALAQERGDAARGLSVDAALGVVRLSGVVDTYDVRRQLGGLAAGIPGVVRVDNDLRLKADLNRGMQPPLRRDPILLDDIREQLFFALGPGANDVGITMERGTVTLTGEVASQWDKQEATEAAVKAGALSVDNNLTLRGVLQ